MLPSLLIIDDFLGKPDLARQRAMQAISETAENKGNYAGLISKEPIAVDGLEKAVSARVGVSLKAAPGTSHGHIRLALKSDRAKSGVHIDPCFYSGILYLSRPEDCKGGTDFFRHKKTGLECVPQDIVAIQKAGYSDINALIEGVVNKDTLLSSRWERVMRVPMRYNRLILFSPWLFHTAGQPFGNSAENGRLVQLMFFARDAHK